MNNPTQLWGSSNIARHSTFQLSSNCSIILSVSSWYLLKFINLVVFIYLSNVLYILYLFSMVTFSTSVTSNIFLLFRFFLLPVTFFYQIFYMTFLKLVYFIIPIWPMFSIFFLMLLDLCPTFSQFPTFCSNHSVHL